MHEPSLAHALGNLIAEQQRPKPSYDNARWFHDHGEELDRAVVAGVGFGDLYDVCRAHMPQPLPFAAFVAALMAARRYQAKSLADDCCCVW